MNQGAKLISLAKYCAPRGASKQTNPNATKEASNSVRAAALKTAAARWLSLFLLKSPTYLMTNAPIRKEVNLLMTVIKMVMVPSMQNPSTPRRRAEKMPWNMLSPALTILLLKRYPKFRANFRRIGFSFQKSLTFWRRVKV